MQCPECRSNNREGVKFCEDCGARLEIACSACQTKIPLGKKFCGQCGHPLEAPAQTPPPELSFDEKIEKLQRYLPQGITDKILSQKDKIEGERKIVTVMFCDLAGFTPMVASLGPEEAYNVMDQVYEILIHKVHEFEGIVNEMTGDGVMALFGAPIALEDAPQRAIRSAMAVHRELAKFNEQQNNQRRHGLKMRIGIHTGPVVVGTLGNDLRVEFKAVGDTVNVASRVEGLAEPGTTYVTGDTFNLTAGFFRFESVGEKQLKGKPEPVRIYRVIASSSRKTRFDISAERGLTPFIGRARELELLLDSFERSKRGTGQAISILAEAGVGKSRLLYEFRKIVAHEDVTFLEGKCLSYSRGVAYHPVIDILKSNFNIQDEDEDFEIRAKVQRGLERLGVDQNLTLPYLLELLSVGEIGDHKISISPEAKKERIMEAAKIITLRGSQLRPLIVAIEDLHWIDRSSEEYLSMLLDNISGANVLLIFTYRPDFVHTWGRRSYHSQVNLNRLSNRESLAMVTHILGSQNFERQFEELILEKSEGVPFFIEEFIKSLKELNMIDKRDGKYALRKGIQKISIPSRIQDVIMARVDSLPEGAKNILQTGSVIEREFDHSLIKQLTDLPDHELMTLISILKDSELIYERGIFPESTYIFKHALTREVVYGSILNKRRIQLHNAIGLSVEKLYVKNIEEKYGILAEHFFKGENHERAEKYLRLSGKAARKKSAYLDAITYAEKGVLCIEKLPRSETTQKRLVDARTLLAGYHMSINHHVQAKEAIAPIVESAQKMDYQKRLPTIYVILGSYSLLINEDFSSAIRYLDKALDIAHKTNDYFSLWSAYWFAALGLYYENETEKSIEHLHKGIALSEAAQNLGPALFLKSYIVTWFYNWQAKIERAQKISLECVRVAEEIGDIYYKTPAYISYGGLNYIKGDFEKAESYLLQALSFSEKTGHYTNWMTACQIICELYWSQSKYDDIVYYYEKMITLLTPTKYRLSEIGLYRVCILAARVKIQDQAFQLDEMFNYYHKIRSKAMRLRCGRYICETLANDDLYLDEAENWIERIIETDRRCGFKHFIGRDYAIYADILTRKGDTKSARKCLNQAIKIFKECGADGWVAKIENNP